uniref:Ras-associating domain-containing protein n=1 Tax=Romanomermis culicivorax TaxID=13658 RepID=A0A915IWF8_ROMCU
MQISFLDLAFLRFSVVDSNNNKCYGQRIVPVKLLRAGYRHLRLRNMLNAPLEYATLFIHSRLEEEEFISVDDDYCPPGQSSFSFLAQKAGSEKIGPILKKQIFILKIYGIFPDNSPVSIRVQNSTTVDEVITLALSQVNKQNENVDDYILVEEMTNFPSPVVHSPGVSSPSSTDVGGSAISPNNTFPKFGQSFDAVSLSATATSSSSPNPTPSSPLYAATSTPPSMCQRILKSNDQIMNAIANWNGAKAKFVLRKKGSDPSSRAWITTIIKSGKEKNRKAEQKVSNDMAESTFLVCIHNISDDQPYAILRAPVYIREAKIHKRKYEYSKKVLMKARRLEDPINFVLIEETSGHQSGSLPGLVNNSNNAAGCGSSCNAVASSSASVSSPNAAIGGVQSLRASFFGSVSKIAKAAATMQPASTAAVTQISRRILEETETVFNVQSHWKTTGRFVLRRKDSLSEKDFVTQRAKRRPVAHMKSLNFPKFWSK